MVRFELTESLDRRFTVSTAPNYGIHWHFKMDLEAISVVASNCTFLAIRLDFVKSILLR